MRSFWHEQVGKLGGDLVSADREVKVSEAERRAAEETFKQRRNQIEQQIQDAKRQAEGERERLQAWVGQLLQTSPAAGHKIWEARPSADRFWYLLPKYDVFEQLRVLEDLRAGRPPLWQGASTEMKNQLAEEYGLVDPQPCRPRTPCDSLTWERHLARTHTYLVSWIVVFFIALIPPALVMAMKLLMSQDLKDYYSAEQQATDGTTGSLPTNLTAAGLSRI